jgi:DNA polymerase-3 subunit gamma/tau
VQRAPGLQADTILAGLDILAGTRARLRTSGHGRVLLEMAFVRLARLDDLVPLSQLVQALGQAKASPAPAAPARAAGTATAAAVRPPEQAPAEGVKKKQPGGAEPAAESAPLALTTESLPQVWQQVLAQVGPVLGSELGKADIPAISGPNTLVLRFASRYNFQRERCQDPARLGRIEEALRKVTGRAYALRIEAGAGAPDTDASSAHGSGAAETSPERARRQRDEVLQAPLIQRAVETLGAQVIRLDDGFGAAPATAGSQGETARPGES